MNSQVTDSLLERGVLQAGLGQPLNAADCALLSVDRTLREMGCPGFETQMLVWLAGRADVVHLREAVACLSRLHPVVASRLVESDGRGESYWHYRPGAECQLREIDLDSAHDDAVLDQAGLLLSTACDPAENDPIRFHILHRPDGRDVFLLQYNHTLMDINTTMRLIVEIDRLCRACPDLSDASVSSPPRPRDILRNHLRQFPLSRRKTAMRSTLALWGQSLRGGARMLGCATRSRAGSMQLRVATRQLDSQQTRALQSRVVSVCGFPALSMALMGSAFRVIDRLSPQQLKGDGTCVAGIGVDLGLHGKRELTFQNLVSVVPVFAKSGDLRDRDNLVQMLSRQMRERLAEESDLGMLQWTATLSKHRRQTSWVLDFVLRAGFSLWYAYFGALDGVGETFGGSAIDRIFYTGPGWSPMGMTLIANQFRGQLLLQATYVPESVPEGLANEFLDGVVGDLLGKG
jgi:hypothetical protein